MFFAAPLFDLAVFGRFLRACIWIWSKNQILFVFVCYTGAVGQADRGGGVAAEEATVPQMGHLGHLGLGARRGPLYYILLPLNYR